MYKTLTITITLAGGLSTAEAQVMCGDVITTPEVLTSDLTCPMDNPAELTIQGPGGSLNMNGFTLSCGGSGADGIHLNGSGAVLQNGTVRDCDIGVEVLPNTSNHRLQTMVLEHNGEDGLDTGGSGTWVTQSTARNNGEKGFENRRGGNSFFIGNRATGNGDDGFLSQDPEGGSTFSRNVASGNGRVSMSALQPTTRR